jgi:hypothetical protein
MPCYSTITQTQITDESRLLQVLSDLKIEVRSRDTIRISTNLGDFYRSSTSSSFSFNGTASDLAPIGRKYAEKTVREWGIRNGMNIVDKSERKITLQRRR